MSSGSDNYRVSQVNFKRIHAEFLCVIENRSCDSILQPIQIVGSLTDRLETTSTELTADVVLAISCSSVR